MADPAPRPAPQPPTGFGELLERSLAAMASPSVFRRAASRPAPSFGAAAGLGLAAGAAALAAALAHASASGSVLTPSWTPPLLAAVGLAALGACASVFLLLAVAFYVAGIGLGGKGEFARALQAAAMISVWAPAQVLCAWFPVAWAAPTLLAAWAAAEALEGLFDARRGPARALCALLAAGAIGLQFAGRRLAGRARDAYAATRAVGEIAASNAGLARSMSELTRQMQTVAVSTSAGSAATAASGLDLLRGGPLEGDDASPLDQPLGPASSAAPPRSGPALDAAAQAVQTNAMGMLDALAPLLDGIANAKSMGPRQKEDIRQIQGLMQELKSQMTSGKKMDNAVFAEKMARSQALLMRLMAYSAQVPAAPAAERKPPMKPPKENP